MPFQLLDLNISFVSIFLLMGLLSILGVALFIERWLFLRTLRGSNLLSDTISEMVEKEEFANALLECEKSSAVSAPLLKVGLLRREERKETVEKAMTMEGTLSLAKAERHCRFLALIAYIAPLLGLLGTTLGFLHGFSQMGQSAFSEISSQGIGEAMQFALITTASGLIIAIPATLGYHLLAHEIEQLSLDMKTAGFSLLDQLYSSDWKDGY